MIIRNENILGYSIYPLDGDGFPEEMSGMRLVCPKCITNLELSLITADNVVEVPNDDNEVVYLDDKGARKKDDEEFHPDDEGPWRTVSTKDTKGFCYRCQRVLWGTEKENENE